VRFIAALAAFSLLSAPIAAAQDDAPLEGARPGVARTPEDYAAILAFDICAAVVANGAARLGPTIAATPGLRVTPARPVSSLAGDMGLSVQRMLEASPETPVRTVAPPEEAVAGAPFLAVTRVDAQACVVVSRGVADALGPVFTRLANPESGWTHADERNGAHLYRRSGQLRMILAPRQGDTGADQIIVFRERQSAPATP